MEKFKQLFVRSQLFFLKDRTWANKYFSHPWKTLHQRGFRITKCSYSVPCYMTETTRWHGDSFITFTQNFSSHSMEFVLLLQNKKVIQQVWPSAQISSPNWKFLHFCISNFYWHWKPIGTSRLENTGLLSLESISRRMFKMIIFRLFPIFLWIWKLPKFNFSTCCCKVKIHSYM